MSDERVDIHGLLKAGSFPTARSRSNSNSSDPMCVSLSLSPTNSHIEAHPRRCSRYNPADTRRATSHIEPLERAPRFYSGTSGKVETVHATDAPIRAPPRLSTPPPPPTVEDADDDEDNSYAKPKFRGKADQEHVLEDNEGYINNTEQRFVLVSEPGRDKDAGARDRSREPVEREGRAEKRVDAERKVEAERMPAREPETPPRKTVTPTFTEAEALRAGAAAAAATTATASTPERHRRPSVRRRKSPVDLPRIDTDMYGPRGEGSHHSRSRSSAPSYDSDRRYQAPPSPDRPRPREEFLSPEVIKAGTRNREQAYYYGNGRRAPRIERPSSSAGRRRDETYYHPSYVETSGPRSRPESEYRSARTSRRGSPRRRDEPDDQSLEDLSAFYPDLSRGGTSPQRPRSRRYTNQHSGDESESSVRKSGRRPIVIQTEGRKKIVPEDVQLAEERLRPRSSTASSSPRANGYTSETRSHRDGAPRGPRSPVTGQFESGAPPYPVDDIMPSQERPGYLEPEYWGPGGLGSGARASQGTVPMPIRIPPPGGPRDSNGSRGQGTSRSWQPSPTKPRGVWQDPATGNYPEPRSDISVRRYFEDPRRLGLPAVPRCPRMEPVAGLTDWLTLPECENFTICPTCYGEVFAGSAFRSFFKPLPWQSPETRYFCDFGTFPWYPVAWLMTLKIGLRDLRIFSQVSRIAAKETETGEHCPGSKKGLRMWRSVVDPVTGRALPDFNICKECDKIVGALLPGLRGVFVPTGAEGYGVCSMFGGGDKASFLLYFDALEGVADGAAAAGAPVDEGMLVEGLARVRPVPPCTRDRPVLEGKFFRAPWAPEVLVCTACYEDVACPLLGGNTRAEVLGVRALRYPVGTCKFWEEGSRADFMEGLRREEAVRREESLMREESLRRGESLREGFEGRWR